MPNEPYAIVLPSPLAHRGEPLRATVTRWPDGPWTALVEACAIHGEGKDEASALADLAENLLEFARETLPLAREGRLAGPLARHWAAFLERVDVSGLTGRIPLVFDMETQDPDDFLTLLLLLGHPRSDLRAVTITPGTPDQVGLVRRALEWFGRDIPVGAHNLDHRTASAKRGEGPGEGSHGPRGVCVSSWHYKAYGEVPPSRNALSGAHVLREVCDENVTLVTGGPMKNLGAALKLPGFRLGRLVAQGGFAGEGVVPPEKQLEKFRGRVTCPTFNLNGDPPSALAALASPAIGRRLFVSKNVCHGVVYGPELHTKVEAVKRRSKYLELIWQGMEYYLSKREGKAFHDPLAACCALDESIGTWAEVNLYRERGEWGARLASGTRTQIIVDYDREKFEQTLLGA
jgi:inosine-uridine nucleoside N-ribohydrolase